MANTVLICSPTASIAGGVQTWLRELCVRLDRRRWRPLVALLRGGKAHDARAYQAAWAELETIEVDGTGLAAPGRIRAVERCLRRVEPDVFVPLTAVDAHHAACRGKAQQLRFRYLLHVPGNVAAQIADAQECAPWADLAVAPGRLNARLLDWAGVPADRIRYVPYGAGQPEHQRTPRAPGAPLRLGYVGRLSAADKRVRDLVPLCAELERRGVSYTLSVAGDGPERTALESALSRLAQVRFLGRLDARALYEKVYPQLDVLLLFSESESFGIVAIEAMLHGVVPVTSAFVGSGAEGILRGGTTALLFPIGDMESAGGSVERLATSASLLQALSEAARAAVTGRFTWQRCVDGWAAALDDAMALPLRTGTKVPGPATRPGRLERIGLPAAVTDVVRRARMRVLGMPPAMLGGEEWPWIRRDHSPIILDEITQTARRLDALNA
jgi:glycosyltransferase involved in cell wall biosynthesis